ncbi:hypothetical protein P152DRAFT_475367 [Eremomyces bilateralis CBS 781.70]|nr:uncharacterized protein P152DRAFT_475866 [Eremomyces bilateralis CBS 781.70]XP_033532155.1 uncharacterized protein P152DRAFT_475367 [Eremomyces bilateralis CBS 781.70]KAF1810006.1 hypothetical protein P152DRAFT_475866 [Eremomyces bilateralis CBS 781.70]KAF1810524.1 hypothetical protein P152DRAFT_475367 [Eremomyces bilateralis CBS 781.70]
MKALEEAGGMFSAYQVHREREKSLQASIGREGRSEDGQSEDGQKPEDYECILDDLRFGWMYEQVNTHAPLLCGLLDGLMAPKIERKDRPPRDPSKFNHRTAIITSILCYSRASEGSNKFPRVFGAFLHSNGVKRRVLDLFHQFGGTVRRYGQLLNACVVYDNFDYREGVKHQLISNHAEMRSVTTGKVFRGADIPPGGLRKSMLHRETPLSIEDLFYSPGAAIYDETASKIDSYFIAEAIRTAYPKSVKSIFSNSDIPFPAMPTVELLELRKTDSKTLGPILFNEGTLDGSYEVIESIYKRQFQLDSKEFDNRLFLAFGDQKTSSLIRSMQAEQVDASISYDRKDWLIGVAALFHLRMNFLWLMQKTHYGNMEQQDASTLYHNINFWGRKNIPADRAAFQVLEELVLHSFDARVIGLLYTRLEQYGIDTSDQEEVDKAIQNMNTRGFMDLVEDVRRSAFGPEAWRPSKEKHANNTVDEEFLSHARYLQQMVVYKTLKYGIKNGDIGLIDRVIGVCCFYFEGTGQSNYAFEMLYLKRLTSTKACDKELRRAILSNSLVNPHGCRDTWQEVDRSLEYLNLELKRELWARRTSTFGLDALFKTTSLTAEYTVFLRKTIEKAFARKESSKHSVPSPVDDIHILAFELACDSIKFYRGGRKARHQAPDIHTIGLERVATKKLEIFNAKVMRDEDQIIVPPYETGGATADLDPDNDMMAILPLEDRDEAHEWGLPSDIESE